MAAQGRFNAKDMKVYTTETGTDHLIAHVDSCEISFVVDPIDISTKDSNGWKEILAGQGSGTAKISGKVAFDETYQVDALTTACTGKTKLSFKFKTSTVGDTTYAWDGYITSLPLTFGNNEAAMFSCDVAFTGTPTVSTLAS